MVNYQEEIRDIRRLPISLFLLWNLKLATNWRKYPLLTRNVSTNTKLEIVKGWLSARCCVCLANCSNPIVYHLNKPICRYSNLFYSDNYDNYLLYCNPICEHKFKTRGTRIV